ncbi:MAG: (d)CMP kinase [Lachnospiraceae bacterium]|nr:(d)CMP kinase [Lachnospiraceae bacterium]
MAYVSIAIDGPAGAGKSTIAKAVAKKLGFVYVDTGAMYRAMALFFIQNGIGADEEEKIYSVLDKVEIGIEYENGVQQVYLNGENVNDRIRTEEVSHMASASSVYPKVRIKLVELQRAIAAGANVIMDGREIASYVLPNADLKIFLTASVDVRAKRRYDELRAKGEEVDLEDIKKDIAERDYRDSHRDFAPLVQVPDAILVDTSDMGIDEVIEKIIGLAKKLVD